MQELSKDMSVTFIHGSNTFLSRTPSATLQRQRGEDKTKVYVSTTLIRLRVSSSRIPDTGIRSPQLIPVFFVNLKVIEGAGHTIHLEKPVEFNKVVLRALSGIDDKCREKDRIAGSETVVSHEIRV